MAPICFGTNLLGSFGLATRIYTLGRRRRRAAAIFHVPRDQADLFWHERTRAVAPPANYVNPLRQHARNPAGSHRCALLTVLTRNDGVPDVTFPLYNDSFLKQGTALFSRSHGTCRSSFWACFNTPVFNARKPRILNMLARTLWFAVYLGL